MRTRDVAAAVIALFVAAGCAGSIPKETPNLGRPATSASETKLPATSAR